MASSRNTLDMTSGPIFRKLLLYAFPLMVNSLVNTFYNIADKVIAGQYLGDIAVAAVGACTPPINLLNNFFVSTATGASVICGNYIGAHRQDKLRECMHTTCVTGCLMGLLVGVIGILSSVPLLKATSTPEDIFSDAYTYMLVRMIGLPIGITNTFCNNILTAHGDTKRITFSGFLSGLVNVLGNLVFVIVIPMGIAGIALATVLSQALALGIKIYILFSPKDAYRLRLSELRLDWSEMKNILSVGVPAGMNSLAFSVANVMLQSSVNTLGPIVIAGNSGADTLSTMVSLFPVHMSAACGCAVAQCYGAENYPRIRKVVRQCLIGTTIMIVAANVVVTVLARPIMNMFTDNPEVATAGIPKLMYSIWGYVLYDLGLVFAGALKGIRRSGIMMVLNMAGVCLPRIIWVLFVFPMLGTPTVLYMIYPISYAISAVPLGIAYSRCLNQRIEEHRQTAL